MTLSDPDLDLPPVARVKHALNVLALVLTAPCALVCWLERQIRGGRSAAFSFFGQIVAQLPGVPGRFVRRGYYRWTLEHCAETVTIEFGVLFSRQNARLAPGVYVGPYALIGSVDIGENSLIGSRSSLLSGGQHHVLLPSGHWSPTDDQRLRRIRIGSDNWIGEGAIVMNDTGDGCMIAAGAVVASSIGEHTMVAGNPARFVRRLGPQAPHTTEPPAPAPSFLKADSTVM